MRVRSFFICCMSVAALIALIVAGKLVFMDWSSYTAQTAAGEAVASAAALMKIPEQMTSERGAFLVALATDDPADDTVRQNFTKLSAATDKAIDAATETVKIAGYAGAYQQIGKLSDVASDMKKTRDAMDRVLTKAKKDRDPALLIALADQFQKMYAQIDGMVDTVDAAAARADGAPAGFIGIARTSWSMRDYAGRRGRPAHGRGPREVLRARECRARRYTHGDPLGLRDGDAQGSRRHAADGGARSRSRRSGSVGRNRDPLSGAG